MAVKCQNQHNGSWMVYETETGRTAYVHRIMEMFMGEYRIAGYRVDFNGKTVISAIVRFQTAKAWAVKYANGTLEVEAQS